MERITDRLYRYIIENKMTEPGDRVWVGLSGGADSVCLLQLLYELKDRLGISLGAFHVNHCLRGNESDADENYAVHFCEERNIEIRVFRRDIGTLAREHKKGLEEMGRIVRRQAADSCIRDGSASKIALAHHINDRAETVLFNLARGSSIKGLKGISPVNGTVIRPLLCLTRDEIESELNKRNISWCTDSTNLKDDYSRNKMRINVLPYFEKNINAQSIRHISQAAADLEEADEILREIAAEKAEKLAGYREDGIIIYPEILKERKLIAGYILMDALKKLTGTVVDLTRGHTEDILALMQKQNGRSIDLPYGIIAERVYEGIRLSGKKQIISNEKESIPIGNKERLDFAGLTFRIRVFEKPSGSLEIPKNLYTKWFDYDKIGKNCRLRFRNSGDYIISDQNGHRKKLKEYFIDEKIPKENRDKTICLADGSRIIWVIGHRIGEDCKVTGVTEKIIEIKVSGGSINE